MLVVLEGADGVGKTTAARGLRSLLEKDGIKVGLWACPCMEGTHTGDFLRSSLGDGGYILSQYKKLSGFLDKVKSSVVDTLVSKLDVKLGERKDKVWDDVLHGLAHQVMKGRETERSLLFSLNRYETKDHLLKLMRENDLVILDRYIASNLAYNFDERDFFATLELDVLRMPPPDLNVLLDTNIVLKSSGGDVYERSKLTQSSVIENYRALAKGKCMPEWRWEVIPVQGGSGERRPESDISRSIYEIISRKVSRRQRKVGKSSKSG